VEKPGKRRPWKSQERFPLSHSSGDGNLSLDDGDHFFGESNCQRRFAPTTDHFDPGTLITISPEP